MPLLGEYRRSSRDLSNFDYNLHKSWDDRLDSPKSGMWIFSSWNRESKKPSPHFFDGSRTLYYTEGGCVNLNPTGCMGMHPVGFSRVQHPVCCTLLDSAGWVPIWLSIHTGPPSAPLWIDSKKSTQPAECNGWSHTGWHPVLDSAGCIPMQPVGFRLIHL